MVSDRFTWQDAGGQPRVAVLAHNDGQVGPTAGVPNRGGALREFRYQLPGGGTRVAGVTNYGNGGYGGFGYVVSHRGDGTAGIGGADDSPLGYAFPAAFERVFEGRHHAIFRFTQLYPRYSSTTASPANTLYNVPVTIDWVFATGRDNPTWAVTYDLSAVPANALEDDSRAPYGELEHRRRGGGRHRRRGLGRPVQVHEHDRARHPRQRLDLERAEHGALREALDRGRVERDHGHRADPDPGPAGRRRAAGTPPTTTSRPSGARPRRTATRAART